MAEPYRLLTSRSSAADFHRRAIPDPARPELWWHRIDDVALVLGSSQPEGDVDVDACRSTGIDVVRRRSGGGAVLLVPGEVTWLDVIVPAGSEGWSDDVHGPMVWFGHHLAAVLRTLLPDHHVVEVHDRRMVTTDWSSLVCFDGLGSGEVLLDGRKLVGMSQRRSRPGARLQCCWYSTYDPSALVELLAEAGRPPLTDLRPVATVPREVAEAVPGAVLRRLRNPSDGPPPG